MGLFGRGKINDPYNTLGAASPAPKTAKRPASPEKRKPRDAAQVARIKAYTDSVAANYKAGYPLPESTQAYRALTRSDCAILWRPDCPEANDPTRRP